MAIYEVLLYQSYFGQRTVTRFNYVSSGSAGSALPSFALVKSMGFAPADIVSGGFPANTLARSIQQLQSSAAQFVGVYAKNLYSETDFYEAAFPAGTVGSQPGVGMSPAVAYGFVSNRTNLGVRRATRRLTGVIEEAVGAGGMIESVTIGTLLAVAARFEQQLSYTLEDASLSFVPAVLSRLKYPTSGGRFAYKPYPTEQEQLAHTAQGVTWGIYRSVRTQTSRQYGRGT